MLGRGNRSTQGRPDPGRYSGKLETNHLSYSTANLRPSYSTVKNWVARFTTGHLSTEDNERARRPIPVTIPESMDAIHSMILDD
jgi:hypothetical protein